MMLKWWCSVAMLFILDIAHDGGGASLTVKTNLDI
jgi:hypothetical protein